MLEKAIRWQGKLYGKTDNIEVTCLDTVGKESPYNKITLQGKISRVGTKYILLEIGDWYWTEDHIYQCKCAQFDWHTILEMKLV